MASVGHNLTGLQRFPACLFTQSSRFSVATQRIRACLPYKNCFQLFALWLSRSACDLTSPSACSAWLAAAPALFPARPSMRLPAHCQTSPHIGSEGRSHGQTQACQSRPRSSSRIRGRSVQLLCSLHSWWLQCLKSDSTPTKNTARFSTVIAAPQVNTEARSWDICWLSLLLRNGVKPF